MKNDKVTTVIRLQHAESYLLTLFDCLSWFFCLLRKGFHHTWNFRFFCVNVRSEERVNRNGWRQNSVASHFLMHETIWKTNIYCESILFAASFIAKLNAVTVGFRITTAVFYATQWTIFAKFVELLFYKRIMNILLQLRDHSNFPYVIFKYLPKVSFKEYIPTTIPFSFSEFWIT